MINYKKILLFPINLLDVKLSELSVKKSKGAQTQSKKQSVKLKPETWSELDEENNLGYMYLKLNCSIKYKNENFKIVICYKGICKNNLEESISNEKFSKFLEIQALKSLWPYMRETLNDISFKVGIPSIVLPTVDTLKMAEMNGDEKK